MSLQTFLDIASRTAASAGAIRELGQLGDGELDQHTSLWLFRFNPVVELISGPPCELWSLNIQLCGQGEFRVPGPCNATVIEPHEITFHGIKPLFPRVRSRACEANIELRGPSPPEVRASLSVGAAHPVIEMLKFNL